MALSMSNFARPNLPEVAILSASLPDWNIPQTKTMNMEKHDVEVHCDRIKHRDWVSLREVFLVPEQKGSFQIKYEIMCDEYADPACGAIDVEVV